MSKQERLLYIFVAISSVIFILEGYIPRPLPWIKLGLSNVITLLLVYYFPFTFVIKVVLFRVLIGSIFAGTFLTPSFFLSLGGGISSAIIMSIFKKFCGKIFSPLGISILGAEAHIFTQLFIVYFFIIKDKDIFNISSFLMIFALGTGGIIGCIGGKVIKNFEDFYNSYFSSSI